MSDVCTQTKNKLMEGGFLDLCWVMKKGVFGRMEGVSAAYLGPRAYLCLGRKFSLN